MLGEAVLLRLSTCAVAGEFFLYVSFVLVFGLLFLKFRDHTGSPTIPDGECGVM